MSTTLAIFFAILYFGFMFLIAYYGDQKGKKGQSIVNNPYIYALSLSVFCTAWTFFGNVELASTNGLAFVSVFLGPTILAPLWIFVLKKIIIISKNQRITSIADFISARYGKSTALGVIATLIAVFGIIPYISIQLKAISFSFDILATENDFLGRWLDSSTFYRDKALIVTIVLSIFAILFGTRKLDPNERHEGMVAAVAFESIIKLLAFVAIGLYVTYGIYGGFGDIFSKAMDNTDLRKLITLPGSGVSAASWLTSLVLSMSAVLFLPRQFHIAVVENTNPRFVDKAAWLFPLYLFLINIFVIPIAFGGKMLFEEGSIAAGTYVLNLPLYFDQNLLAMFVFIGGFAAATSMVIVSVIALSIMISNNIVTPILLKSSVIKDGIVTDVSYRLLWMRRIGIIVVLLMAYGYYEAVAKDYSLISIGMISFTAVAQFAPVVIGGLYWKRATKPAAIAALVIGSLLWFYTLPLITLSERGVISQAIIENGLWGFSFLKPNALFGLEGYDRITHGAFWSLLFNVFTYIIVSLNTKPSPLELTQADLFVDIYKYNKGKNDIEVMKREARIDDVKKLLYRFLGKLRAKEILIAYEKRNKLSLNQISIANADLIKYAETHLTGALGAASAKAVIGSIVKEEPISLEEIMEILDQTQEIVSYSKALEIKSEELEATTRQLKSANERLKELDLLKADFITTITHELRTPITSIKALSKILADNPQIAKEKKEKYLHIIVNESERIARLINQVLDLEKIDTLNEKWEVTDVNLNEVIYQTLSGFEQILIENGIELQTELIKKEVIVEGNKDRLIQVIVNLVSNAIKFCSKEKGIINVKLESDGNFAVIRIIDNGLGIEKKNQALIFEKFTQVNDDSFGKPKGSGLGLFICRRIIQRHKGLLTLKSKQGEGAEFKIKLPYIYE